MRVFITIFFVLAIIQVRTPSPKKCKADNDLLFSSRIYKDVTIPFNVALLIFYQKTKVVAR